MDLYNPFTGETVEVSKSVSPMYGAKNAFANEPTKKVGMMLPTGGHVSHANDLFSLKRGKRTTKNDQALYHHGSRRTQKQGVAKNLATQPGMINPGITTNSWSHGSPNQDFSGSQGRRGRKIS